MRVTANIIDDSYAEDEASITIVARCMCGGALTTHSLGGTTDSAWTEAEDMVVVPLRCEKCYRQHVLQVNVRSK